MERRYQTRLNELLDDAEVLIHREVQQLAPGCRRVHGGRMEHSRQPRGVAVVEPVEVGQEDLGDLGRPGFGVALASRRRSRRRRAGCGP